jgi:hypothetical protein
MGLLSSMAKNTTKVQSNSLANRAEPHRTNEQYHRILDAVLRGTLPQQEAGLLFVALQALQI